VSSTVSDEEISPPIAAASAAGIAIIQRMFAAEEELQNLVTPDAESEDPQEARLTARQVRQHAAVCLPRPPMRFLPSYTHKKSGNYALEPLYILTLSV